MPPPETVRMAPDLKNWKFLNKMTRIGRLFRIYSERIIRPPIVAIEKGMKRVSWRLCKAPRNFNNIPYEKMQYNLINFHLVALKVLAQIEVVGKMLNIIQMNAPVTWL